MNRFADRDFCTCPSPCEVCTYAASFATGRRVPGADGTEFWTELSHAVARDLGRMA